MRMSSASFQIGSRIFTVGQLSFCSHWILQPSAEDSWMIEKTGMMLSKPSSVWPVAARRAISSGLRLASGK